MSYIGRDIRTGAFRQLDDISSGFDGSDTTHTMQVNSTNVSVGDVNQILLSLGGVIQKPGTDFTVSGSTLTFTTAPAANTSFFAILLGSDNGGTVTPTDGSVTGDKIASNAAITTTGAANFNGGITMGGTTPTLTIGDAGAEDTKIVFDGNAQDFYVGLDDSADDLIIGLGSTVGTTPIISVDENKDVSIPDGGLTITTDDNTAQLTLTSTDADGNAGPILIMNRNSSSPADNDFIGNIQMEMENDAGENLDAVSILGQIIDASDGTEDARLYFYMRTAGTMRDAFHISPTETVFNDDTVDRDFRVETDANAVAFKVDAGNNVAGIMGTGSTIQFNIENQNSGGGNSCLLLNNPSSGDQSVQQANNTTRSSGLSGMSFFRGNSNNGADVEFIFRGDGNGFCDGSFSGGGADYAEYFEWKDGNASDEDRIGYSVVLDGDKIVKATDSDDASKIIGVISANPAVVGDSDILRWKQKFLLDDFGREVTEEITVTEWKGEWTGEDGILQKQHIFSYDTDRIPSDVTVPSDAEVKSEDGNGVKFLRRKTNPDWDKDMAYISREDRKEWDTVGLMGKLRLRKGQPTGTNWIKMRDISDTVEEWLVR
jgi:hypothetical protein